MSSSAVPRLQVLEVRNWANPDICMPCIALGWTRARADTRQQLDLPGIRISTISTIVHQWEIATPPSEGLLRPQEVCCCRHHCVQYTQTTVHTQHRVCCRDTVECSTQNTPKNIHRTHIYMYRAATGLRGRGAGGGSVHVLSEYSAQERISYLFF